MAGLGDLFGPTTNRGDGRYEVTVNLSTWKVTVASFLGAKSRDPVAEMTLTTEAALKLAKDLGDAVAMVETVKEVNGAEGEAEPAEGTAD